METDCEKVGDNKTSAARTIKIIKRKLFKGLEEHNLVVKSKYSWTLHL